MINQRFPTLILLPILMVLHIGCAELVSEDDGFTTTQSSTGVWTSFPGRPGNAPQNTRWSPGHFEVKNGEQVWVRGSYVQTNQIAKRSTAAYARTTPYPQNPQSAAREPLGSLQAAASSNLLNSPAPIQEDINQVNSGVGVFRPLTVTKRMVAGHEGKWQYSSIKPKGWAVVIGISKYENGAGKLPALKYASRDARAFSDFLLSPYGGGYPPERVVLLNDEKATLDNMKHAFFNFLKQADKRDYIIVFFSGHGISEESDSNNLYLLAYDSQPDQLFSTALPLWDIDTAFSRFVKSDKIIMFADVCHTDRLIGRASKQSAHKKNMINKYILELGKTKTSRIIFTASELGELSQESRKWGGGHGVFTYYLINGLKGEADINDDNRVTIGETIDFVVDNVRRSTKNNQNPNIAGVFDLEFPIVHLQP